MHRCHSDWTGHSHWQLGQLANRQGGIREAQPAVHDAGRAHRDSRPCARLRAVGVRVLQPHDVQISGNVGIDCIRIDLTADHVHVAPALKLAPLLAICSAATHHRTVTREA